MMTANDPRICEVCGEKLVRVSSGYVCPNGHGRIRHWSMVDNVPVAKKLNLHADPFPKAKLVHNTTGPGDPNQYEIEGLPGLYRLFRRWNKLEEYKNYVNAICYRTVVCETPGVIVRARDYSRIRKFVLIKEAALA